MLRVNVVKVSTGFLHEFYYGSDLRFSTVLDSVDAAAIYCWVNELKYKPLNF